MTNFASCGSVFPLALYKWKNVCNVAYYLLLMHHILLSIYCGKEFYYPVSDRPHLCFSACMDGMFVVSTRCWQRLLVFLPHIRA